MMVTKTNRFIFYFLHVIVWIVFVGLSIEFGALLVNFLFNVFRPEAVPRLYEKLDMQGVYRASTTAFYVLYGLALCISFLKAVMFYLVILLMFKIDLNRPFTLSVATRILSIAYVTIAVGVLILVAKQVAKNMTHRGVDLSPLGRFWGEGDAFLFTGAIIYIIAVIFKTGTAIQKENELTV